jgi:hypothetical protein
MKLRFKADQAEALRQGVDAPTQTDIVTINACLAEVPGAFKNK